MKEAKGQACTHVNVEPAVVLLADIGNFLDGIEGADDRGAGRRVHEEGYVALGLALDYQLLEALGYHAAALVARHHHAVVGAEAAYGRARAHRVVALEDTGKVVVVYLREDVVWVEGKSCSFIFFLIEY